MATVLIVDDSSVDRSLAGGLLGGVAGLKIEFAVNGRDAWQKIGREQPDLVLTDLIMPEMDGLELVAKVVSAYPSIPVILITGRGSEETAVQALKSGAASYVPKRLLTELLVTTVQGVLEASQEEQCESRLMNFLACSDSTFVLPNNASLVGPLVNHVHRTMRAVGLYSRASVLRVCIALEEALNNALFHGNLELSSEFRTSDGHAYQDLVDERTRTPPFCNRSIHVQARFTCECGRFLVRDEGPGFDPEALPDPTDPENVEKGSGRGLLLMRTFMDSVAFNKIGNEVTMSKRAEAGGKNI
jgi:CheY-like chemotaxis protein/anti-sigma regulatory factor (Ser/Thr protein kinase)